MLKKDYCFCLKYKKFKFCMMIMKKTIYFLLAVLVFSCNKKEEMVEVKETSKLVEPENPLNKLKYDNELDFYCKMDIKKYGVADTAHYKGKLYGFCAKTCKDKFLKEPEKYLQEK